jgi:hypothetical protein
MHNEHSMPKIIIRIEWKGKGCVHWATPLHQSWMFILSNDCCLLDIFPRVMMVNGGIEN